MDEPDGPPRWALITALTVAVVAVLIVLVVAANRRTPQSPVPVAAVPAPAASGPDCAGLLEHLPDQLGDFTRAPVADPAPPGVAAWRRGDTEDPVVLRCGLARPAEFVVGAPIQVVDAVQWFSVREGDRATWFAVDRPVYVALTLPAGSGPTPIQEVSEVIATQLAAHPIDPSPVG